MVLKRHRTVTAEDVQMVRMAASAGAMPMVEEVRVRIPDRPAPHHLHSCVLCDRVWFGYAPSCKIERLAECWHCRVRRLRK